MSVMREISLPEATRVALESLGLDADTYDLQSPEAICAALLRATAFCCPCPPRTLVRSVLEAWGPLVDDAAGFQESLEYMLEALVAYGDLIEGADWRLTGSEGSGTTLYAAPPGFVTRESGAVLLFGGVPDANLPLPDDIRKAVVREGHVRRLETCESGPPSMLLAELGLIEFSMEAWLRLPQRLSPSDCIQLFDARLQRAAEAGDLGELVVLDPSSAVTHYRNRWRPVDGDTGRFVCRRPRRYGADLWCYVDLDDGEPRRLIDLPIEPDRARGCDEAWWLQAAIDATRGKPQRVRAAEASGGRVSLEFFSPIPMWASRRLDVVGKPVTAAHGNLFAYTVPSDEAPEELRFLREHLWLSETSN